MTFIFLVHIGKSYLNQITITKIWIFSKISNYINVFICFRNEIWNTFFNHVSNFIDAIPQSHIYSFAFCLNHCTSGI